jgi:hypothetical protein
MPTASSTWLVALVRKGIGSVTGYDANPVRDRGQGTGVTYPQRMVPAIPQIQDVRA